MANLSEMALAIFMRITFEKDENHEKFGNKWYPNQNGTFQRITHFICF